MNKCIKHEEALEEMIIYSREVSLYIHQFLHEVINLSDAKHAL